MCEKCVEKLGAAMDDANILASNIDEARVRELLETVHEIAKRNNWPFFAHCCARGTDGTSLNSLIHFDLSHVGLFAAVTAMIRRPEAGLLLMSLYEEHASTSEALTRAKEAG